MKTKGMVAAMALAALLVAWPGAPQAGEKDGFVAVVGAALEALKAEAKAGDAQKVVELMRKAREMAPDAHAREHADMVIQLLEYRQLDKARRAMMHLARERH